MRISGKILQQELFINSTSNCTLIVSSQMCNQYNNKSLISSKKVQFKIPKIMRLRK